MTRTVVTGPSSGIGQAITAALLKQGDQVVGLSRRADQVFEDQPNYTALPVDLCDTAATVAACDRIAADGPVDRLIYGAGLGHFGPHETLRPPQIARMTMLNLTAPMLMTSALLRRLKERRGSIILISSTAGIGVHGQGAVYSATKAGLNHFGDCLFEETRRAGVSICTICPDMTAGTGFYDHAQFAPDESSGETHLTPELVAQTVCQVLSHRPGAQVTRLVVKPQRIGITKRQPTS